MKIEGNMISTEFTDTIWIYFQSNLTEKTKKEYWKVLCDYDRITGKDLIKLSVSDADMYFNSLIDRVNKEKLAYSTAVMRLSVIRSISEFIHKYNERHGNNYENYFRGYTIPEPDKTINPESIPTPKELDGILKIMRKEKDLTALLIFLLGIKCGLTSKEISQIKRSHIFEEAGNNLCIKITKTVANTRRTTPATTVRIARLPKDISKLLDAFLSSNDNFNIHCYDTCNDTLSPYIFTNKHGTNMKVRDIERLIKKYMDLAMEKKIINKTFTMQDLRHAAFVYMLKGGAGKEKVADYGGISTKWMSRYDKIVTSKTFDQAIDYSIIKIDTSKLSK